MALSLAINKLLETGIISKTPIKEAVAAISVGMYQGAPLLDLDYNEDSNCDVDMNIVMTATGKMIEVQGTAEGEAFSRNELNALLDLGQKGIEHLIALQNQALAK